MTLSTKTYEVGSLDTSTYQLYQPKSKHVMWFGAGPGGLDSESDPKR